MTKRDKSLDSQRLEGILSTAVDAIITVDSNCIVEAFNPAAEEIFGYGAEEVIGKNINLLIPEPYAKKHNGYVKNYFETGKSRIIGAGREVTGKRKDGTIFLMELSVAEMKVGNKRKFNGTVRDISVRKKYEDALEKYLTELERSNKELDDFAYVASHDLRSPLRGIDNLAQWIQDDTADILPEDSKEHLAKLRMKVRHLENLLEAILLYSKVGRQDESSEETSSKELVEEVVETLNVPEDFTVEIQPDMPVVFTEKIRLQQVFLNLVSNALKYHDNVSKGVIKVACNDKGKFYEFSVNDNGPGIPEQYQKKIFHMFQRLQSKSSKTEGSGMGLAFIKKIVENKGGKLCVESKEGEGSTFKFTWPKQA